MRLRHINAALQTERAGRWEMLMVRLFGTLRIEMDDEGRPVALLKWRGRSYLLDIAP